MEEVVAEEGGLFQDGLGGAFLEVWGVAVAAEDALGVGAEAGGLFEVPFNLGSSLMRP